ncbi:MAG: glycosyltransferase, partial [Nitrospinales bacterium]
MQGVKTGPMIAVTLLQFALVVGVVVYLTLNMLHLERVQPEPTPAPPSSPLVSVCVPVRNEERNVEACLVSLMRQ